MKKKIFFLIITTVTIVILAFFFLKFLDKDKKNISNKNLNSKIKEEVTTERSYSSKIKEEVTTERSYSSNIIENVRYSSNDPDGNEYIIVADQGEIDIKNSQIIFLKNVKATIKLKNSDKIKTFYVDMLNKESISTGWPKVCMGMHALIGFFELLNLHTWSESTKAFSSSQASNAFGDKPNVFLSTSIKIGSA